MRPTLKTAAFVLLVGGAALGASRSRREQDVVAAEQRAGIAVTRIFTGPDGETHAEESTVKLTRDDLSTEVSARAKATGVQFRRQDPHFFEDWHTTPRKQYVITLSGRGEIELSDGRKIPLEPGRIVLVEDLTGKGHISRGMGTEDRISVLIPLAE